MAQQAFLKNMMTKKILDGASCGRSRIMVVDDEELIANMIGQILTRLGYETDIQINPVKALELFKAEPHSFDLIITDMVMPQMTGSQFSKKLKEIKPDIPIILCTGYSSLVDEDRARQIGLTAYLIKPISMTELAETVSKII